MEHLNKIMKAITTRGLKRITSIEDAKRQRKEAAAAGRDFRGLHGLGGTHKQAMTESVARSEIDRNLPDRASWREREKFEDGRVDKVVFAKGLAQFKAGSGDAEKKAKAD